MNHRVLASTLTLAIGAMAPSAFAQAPAAKTPPTAAVKTTPAAAVPRTADGHPDVSGVFSNVTAVPMARPANGGGREF